MKNNLKQFFVKSWPFWLFAGLLLWWFFKDLWPFIGMLSYNDRLPFAPTFQEGWHIFTNSWQEQFPGILIPPYNLILLKEALQTLIFFNNAELAQKIDIILPPVLGFISFYWFWGKLKITSGWAKLIGGCIFSLNLVVLGELVGGTPVSITAHAFWPPIFYFAYKLFSQRDQNGHQNLLNILYLALFTFLAFIFGDWLIFFILGLVILFAVINLYHRTIPWSLFIKNFLLFLGISLLLSLSYILIYYDILKEMSLLPESYRQLINKSLMADVNSSYASFNFLSFIGLGAGPFYEKIFGGHGWGYFSLLAPILALGGLIFSPPQHKKIAWVLTIIALSIFLFVYGTKLGWFNLFYLKIPLLFRFRNAVHLSLLLSFVLATLGAFFLQWLMTYLHQKKFKFSILIGLAIFALWLIAILPFVRGQILQGRNNLTIPKYYPEIISTIQKERETNYSRTLWLPWDFEVSKRIYWQDLVTNGLFINYGQYLESSYNDFLKELYLTLENKDIKALKSALSLSKSQLIIIDKNRISNNSGKIKEGTIFLTPVVDGDPAEFQKLVLETGDYAIAHETNDYVILKSKSLPAKEVEFFNQKIDLYPLSFNDYFKILTQNKLDLQKGIFDLKNPQESAKINQNQFDILLPQKLIFLDKFQNGPDEKIWLKSPNVTGKKSPLLLGGGDSGSLSTRSVYSFETTFEVSLAAKNPHNYGYLGLRDQAGNGFGFDLTLKTGSGESILDIVGQNGQKSLRQTVSPRDDQEHSYKMEWHKDRIDFFLDNEIKGTFTTNLEGAMPLSINASQGQSFLLSSVSATSLSENKIFWQKGDSSPLRDINWQIKKTGLNSYNLELTNPPDQFVFVFNHPYASGWQAKYDGKVLPHFAANGIFNGFVIENYQKGDIIISYQPQKARNIALILNGLTILVVLVGIFYLKRKIP